MLFSKTFVHGVYILCHLSRQQDGTVVPASAVADAMSVPPEQTAKILRALMHAGMVSSERGRRGGYALARSPEEITMADLVDALGPEEDDDKFGPRVCPVAPDESCKAYDGLKQVASRVRELLAQETLAPVIAGTCGANGALFTISARLPHENGNPAERSPMEG